MRDSTRTERVLSLTYADCSTLSNADLADVLDTGHLVFTETALLVRKAVIRLSLRKVLLPLLLLLLLLLLLHSERAHSRLTSAFLFF